MIAELLVIDGTTEIVFNASVCDAFVIVFIDVRILSEFVAIERLAHGRILLETLYFFKSTLLP